MRQAEAFRPIVTARAGGACEYCRLVEAATGVTFHIEHVVPQVRGGDTVFANLALSCPGCNLANGDRNSGNDRNGDEQQLFCPRNYESWLLGWHLHFVLERNSGVIMPRTKIAEATINSLKMNGSNRVFARKLQIQAGLIG